MAVSIQVFAFDCTREFPQHQLFVQIHQTIFRVARAIIAFYAHLTQSYLMRSRRHFGEYVTTQLFTKIEAPALLCTRRIRRSRI